MIAKFAHIGTKELPVPNGRLRDELETRESHPLRSLNSRPPVRVWRTSHSLVCKFRKCGTVCLLGV